MVLDDELDTFPALLRALATQYPEHEAVVAPEGRVPYTELLARCETMAAFYADVGIEPGSRVGVLLPNGLGLNIDGKDIGRVAFVRCLPNGCVAEVVLDDKLIGQLSEGTSAIFVVFRTPEEGVGIPVSLNGFADGFTKLP